MTCKPKHREPVHFNRGRHGHAWICTACGVQLSGPKLPDDEREILVEFARAMRGNGKNLKVRKDITGESQTENPMTESIMQITLHVPMHATNEDIAAALRHRAGLFEGMPAKEAGSRANTDTPKSTPMKKKAAPPVVEEDETETAEEDDEDFAPKKKAATKKAAASFDDDGDDDTEEEEEDEKPVAKKAAGKKAPKISHDDVVDACKEAARENGRPAVVQILKKKFKVESVSDLKPEQYAAVIEAVTSI